MTEGGPNHSFEAEEVLESEEKTESANQKELDSLVTIITDKKIRHQDISAELQKLHLIIQRIIEQEGEFHVARGSGKGGQKRNKSSNKSQIVIEVPHALKEILHGKISAEEDRLRSLTGNTERSEELLKEKLEEAVKAVVQLHIDNFRHSDEYWSQILSGAGRRQQAKIRHAKRERISDKRHSGQKKRDRREGRNFSDF